MSGLKATKIPRKSEDRKVHLSFQTDPPADAAIHPQLTAAFSAVYLAGLLGFATYYLRPSLFRSWFFSSDEYVIAAEVIRFLHLDFRQHFFDMPGTPFMFLSAAIWALVYTAQWVLGLLPPGTDLERFTLNHLPALFTMMRTVTLFFFLCSIVLLFILAARLTNKVGACIASLFLMMSPIYTSYSSFVRVESLSVCLILISILCLLSGLDGTSRTSGRSAQALIFIAGVFAGLAAASRLHSITASLPLLLLLLLTREQESSAYPTWLGLCWKYILVSAFVLGITILITIQSDYMLSSATREAISRKYPKTFAALSSYVVIATMAISAGWALRRVPRTRPLVDRALRPSVFLLLLGCGIGLLAGAPTALSQYQYLLQSQEFYRSSYLDLDRAAWPLLRNVQWFVWYYLRVIAPDNLSLLLLGAGAVTVLIRRNKRLLPFALAAVLFFVSKPINLVAAGHHVIAWLPFYGIIAGYPVARAYDVMSGRVPYGRALKAGVLVSLLGALGLILVPGPRNTARDTQWTEERMHNIALATDWIKQNTEPDAAVAVSYFCFNPDIFFVWLGALDVPVPQYLLDGRRYIIWWGNRSALRGLKGYACATLSDLDAIKIKLDRSSPGEGTDPYADKRFRIVKSFGVGQTAIDVFSFDFR
jgi:hypothetical protein